MIETTMLQRRYRIEKQIGSGIRSVTYRATDVELKRAVAIKVMRPGHRLHTVPATRLSYPRIVPVYDMGTDRGLQYVVMQYIEGISLQQAVGKNTVPVSQAITWMSSVCESVDYAHQRGIIHGDLKPKKVLIASDNLPYVLYLSTPESVNNALHNRPHYLAPEQVRAGKITPAADVYTLGLMLFEMLAGQRPFTGATLHDIAQARLRESEPLLEEYNPRIPQALSDIVYTAMRKAPILRYATAGELRTALLDYHQRHLSQA